MKYKNKPCDGKAKFPSFRQAHKSLNKIQERNKRDKTPVRAYKCDICGSIHLTSQTKWK